MIGRGATLPRIAPWAAGVLLTGPLLFGLGGTAAPAFGYLPALGGTELSLAPMRTMLAQPGLFAGVMLSLTAAWLVTAVALGIVFLFVAAWSGTALFRRAVDLVSPLLAVPHAAAAFGLAFLIAPAGFLARVASPQLTGWQRPPDLILVNDPAGLAMMAGLVAKEIPFLLLITLAALPQIEAERTRALTLSLGYGRIAGFCFAAWPRLYPQIRLATFAVLAFSSSVVDVAIILGPTTPPPLSVQLTRWMQDPDLTMRFVASAGALLQLAVTGVALLGWIGLERAGAALRQGLCQAGPGWRSDRPLRLLGLAILSLAALVTFAGLALLALWSLAGPWPFPHTWPQQLTLSEWRRAGPRSLSLLANTVSLALLTAALATVLAVLCLAREDETGSTGGRRAEWLLYLPLIVPQTAFLFGLQLMFLLGGLGTSLAALVLTHLVFVMPYVFLSLADPWRAFDRRHERIAAGLGKGRWTTLLRVKLPILSRAVLTAAAVGFAVSIGLYLPTVLIGAGRFETITTESVALAAGGDRRVIGVYGLLQTVLPAVGFLVATLLPALIWRRPRADRGAVHRRPP